MSTFPHNSNLLKKDLHVVIFAPYKAMKRIELLKNGLIDDGYVAADMVYYLPNLPEFENIDEDISSSKKVNIIYEIVMWHFLSYIPTLIMVV